ncbi:dipeptidase [Deinococcus cavernae]|uniref:dipeptidase n=1 Tax=Deinococcus cavernae TaxID=2320857 RepID=UPI001F446194|nr:dipeptidase [Deinococcus cavernae]
MRSEILPTAGHPAVYGEWLQAGADRPTVLVYGHYDVQPPEPLELWHNPPFEPAIQDGRITARGVSDDKAPLLLTVQVFGAYLQTLGRLPVNLKVLFEGEEEVGSAHLPALVREQAARLQADMAISADGGMWSADFPSLTVSGRGLTALEFSVHGPASDLHSGRHGGALHNPLHALAAIIASLHDAQGRVAVEGFYDGIAPLSEEYRAGLRTLPFSDEEYLKFTGAAATYGEAGYSTLERQWNRPTVEVNGMWGGYTGEGSKTVLPAQAHAKLTCRLVPGQEPRRIRRLLEDHLRRATPPGVRLEFAPGEHAARAYQLPEGHPARRATLQVLQDVYGQVPLEVGMGGSIPILETFQEVLGVDTVLFSFAVGDENIHAPNEFFRVNRLYEGQHAWVRLLWALGEGLPPQQGEAHG